MNRFVLVLAGLTFVRGLATGQTMARDTVRLSDLQEAAVRNDPRFRTTDLLAQQSSLRLRNMASERLPAIALNGQAQYQSTTFKLPIQLPGVTFPAPYRDTYDAHVEAREQVFDPTATARRNLQRAQLVESQSRVATSLYPLRESVTETFFSALLLQERARIERTSVTDLEAQLAVARARVREGAALPSEAATIEAALLARRQAVDEIESDRIAAIRMLNSFAGASLSSDVALAMPSFAESVVATSGSAVDSLRLRPEYRQYRANRDVLDAERAVSTSRERPRVSLFGRAGYGRPGLNPLAREFDAYWITGLQLDWAPFSWGTSSRERQVLALQGQIVAAEEAAFSRGLARAVENDLADVDRLGRTLATDDTIIELRESILRETRARYAEAVVTSAEYVDRQTDVLAAQLARASHRVELAHARARLFNTLGTGVR